MAKVAYAGRDDLRILGPDDLAKAGVEGFPTTAFVNGQEVEVEDAAAEAIIANPNIFGSFSVIPEQEAQEENSEEEPPSDDKKSSKK